MRILVADSIAEEGLEVLRKYAQVDVKLKLAAEELQNIIGKYDALVVRSGTQVSAKTIESAKRLKVIGRAGVGTDNINIGAATRRGIIVVNTPTSNTISTAEHTIALMLALTRNIPKANSLLKSGVWQRGKLIGTELRGKTLGIIGLGNVGSEVAKRAQAFEMNLIACDPFVSVNYANALKVKLVPLKQLFEKADFVSLHVPLTEKTEGLIGARELAEMKPTTRIINTARGGLVDEEVLVKAIECGEIAGAAFDVFSAEPLTASTLFKDDRVIVTPHLGASTFEAQTNIAKDIAGQVIAALQGQFCRYAINAPYVPPELVPFIKLASAVGNLASQLMDGQISKIHIKYSGEVANHDCNSVKSAILSGLLQQARSESINLVNASFVAAQHGLKTSEEKEPNCQNYSNLLTLKIDTEAGATIVSGTVRDNEVHIVQVNAFWMDIVPSGGCCLLCDHLDRPGVVGVIGTITGRSNINISSMYLSRLQPRGRALMILTLDEQLSEQQRQEILAIPGIHTARAVRL